MFDTQTRKLQPAHSCEYPEQDAPSLDVEPPVPEMTVVPVWHAPFTQLSLSAQQVEPQTCGVAAGQWMHSPSTHVSSAEQQFWPQRVGASAGHLKQPLTPWALPHVVPLGQQRPALPQEVASDGQPHVGGEEEPTYVLHPPARQHEPPQTSGWSDGQPQALESVAQKLPQSTFALSGQLHEPLSPHVLSSPQHTVVPSFCGQRRAAVVGQVGVSVV